jgi:transposase
VRPRISGYRWPSTAVCAESVPKIVSSDHDLAIRFLSCCVPPSTHSGIRTALPYARIAVDHWHLVRLANDMLTEVRQRVAR